MATTAAGEILLLNGSSQTVLSDTTLSISSFGEDAAGEIYVVNLSGTVHKLTPTITSCSYQIAPTSASFPSAGGTGSIAVTANSGCQWTALSNKKWITINSGASGTGNGSVTYSVARNQGRNPRQGTIAVAGTTFVVNQAGR
jgi:hypothetical protein